jgi:hypothetical protein
VDRRVRAGREAAQAVSDADAGVYGLAITSAVDRNGNYGSGELLLVEGPSNALAFVSEGFCPTCQVQLAGSPRNWCPSCKVTWHIRRGATESAP